MHDVIYPYFQPILDEVASIKLKIEALLDNQQPTSNFQRLKVNYIIKYTRTLIINIFKSDISFKLS